MTMQALRDLHSAGKLQYADGQWRVMDADGRTVAGPFPLLRDVEDWLDSREAATESPAGEAVYAHPHEGKRCP